MVGKTNKGREAEVIVKHVTSLPDGTHIVEYPDGRLERRKSQTDWDKLDKLTNKEIEASIARDPDWAGFKDLDWSEAVFITPPQKKAISIRVDQDVLDHFKKHGAGYQRRMNAVLRSYMDQTSGKKRKKRA